MIAVRTLHKKCRVCVSQELQQQLNTEDYVSTTESLLLMVMEVPRAFMP
jgi:hypothetical protein